MEQPNREILARFDLATLPDLDVVVLGALELFRDNELPTPKLDIYKRPLVVGSGNAAVTGQILFEGRDAVFADEGTYESTLETVPDIDGVVLISASGGKHGPIIAKCSTEHRKHVTLITNTDNSKTEPYLDQKHEHDEYVFPKNREPYTYNTSTYMGMVLAKTNENPTQIYDFLKSDTSVRVPEHLGDFDAFYLIIPPGYDAVREMFLTKFDELFGARVSGRVFTLEQTKHAKTVVPSDSEFFISFGEENSVFGAENARLSIPLPPHASHAALMAVGYYVIGHIQKQHPPYFKDHIVGYTKKASAIFGQTINPVVE